MARRSMPLLTLPLTNSESPAAAAARSAPPAGGGGSGGAEPAEAFTSARWKPFLALDAGAAAAVFPPFFPLAGLPLDAGAAVAAGAGVAFAVATVVVIDAEGGGAVALAGTDALISSKGSIFSSHSGLGEVGATATSCFRTLKHCISTCRFQTPSARSANE